MTNDLRNPNEIDKQVMELVHKYDVTPVLEHLGKVAEGQLLEVKDQNDRANLYYQYLACLVKLLKPKQVVELGAAAGISTIMMATEMPKESKLYSVDNDPKAWEWMSREYPQVIKVAGDDLDLNIYPEDTDLDITDIWFIDSLHEEAHLRKELELYKEFFSKGTVLVLDDIHLNPGMEKVWNELPYDKLDISTPCHWSGFGLCVV